jgi:hypothetical protein
VVGGKATLLYNSKAGPLAWIEDKRKNKDKSEGNPLWRGAQAGLGRWIM